MADADDDFDFSWALRLLGVGERLTRTGWGDDGTWIVLQAGYPDGVPLNAKTANATGIPEGTLTRIRPYLMMKTVDDELVPWVASQTDLLASDWHAAGGPSVGSG